MDQRMKINESKKIIKDLDLARELKYVEHEFDDDTS